MAAPEWSGDPDVAAEVISICEARADCFGIIDVPYGSTPTTAVDFINGTGTYSHTAFDTCSLWQDLRGPGNWWRSAQQRAYARAGAHLALTLTPELPGGDSELS